jgi:hypothetical protein
MPAPTPAEESFELYNTLLRTIPGDKEAVQRILWQSRKLERQLPTDFRVRVVLARALATAEEPSEALSAVERIGELWKGQDYDPIVSFLWVLLGLWDLERAKKIVNSLLQVPSLHTDIHVIEYGVRCAVALGDREWLASLANLEKVISDFHDAEDALNVVKESGLGEHFQNHQQLVRENVAGKACFTAHAVVGKEDDAPMITANIFAAADRKECRRIENEISESLATYYESKGLPPGVYIPYFTTIISPLATAAPASAAA